MKTILLLTLLLGWQAASPQTNAQPDPAAFPLAGDWEGVFIFQGKINHVVLHMNTTPEGKMTALLDNTDLKFSGDPATGGSFDGSHLILRFFYWKPNSDRDLEEKFATYDATVNPSNSEMTGVLTQEGSWPLNFKRLTWQAKVPRPAPATIFDGDWKGVEYEKYKGKDLQIHFILHLHNTEDGLMALIDCPEEKFKGALASKVSYDRDSRQITIAFSQEIFAGKMTADGKALDTSMTEPGFHFLVHFDRMANQ